MTERPKSKKTGCSVLDADMVARIAEALIPAKLSLIERDLLHERILTRIGADAPVGTYTIRAGEMQWVTAGAGVDVKVLVADRAQNNQTVLIRMQPGSVVVAHRHTKQEECLILEGEVFIGSYRLSAGDMHIAAPGAMHEQIRAPAGALLLIRSEMPPANFSIT